MMAPEVTCADDCDSKSVSSHAARFLAAPQSRCSRRSRW
jgi:hypothetical protein